jgi:hypothetical protein
MSCLRKGTLAGMILALTLSLPVSGLAQRVKKFADTFDERYPAEQAPTPSSDKHHEAPPSELGHQQTGTPASKAATKVVEFTRANRIIGPKRSKSHFLLVRRFVTDARSTVLRSGHKSVFHPMNSEWVVVRWVSGDCKVWHNDVNLPSGYDWSAVAFANTSDEAYLSMARLYRTRKCA